MELKGVFMIWSKRKYSWYGVKGSVHDMELKGVFMIWI